MHKILLIEDDKNVLEPLLLYLKNEGFMVSGVPTLNKAREEIKFNPPNLMVLDWQLPDGQGIDLLKELRTAGVKIPILLLTARNDVMDKVLSLELGACDYMTKPFEPRELLARIRVQLRAIELTPSEVNSNLEVNGILMDLKERSVHWQSKPVTLTKKEFELLRLFLENPNKAFSRDELLNLVWGFDEYPVTRTVDNHILKLRQSFDEDFFETLRGVGYRFKKVN